jgi:hypothetical protein
MDKYVKRVQSRLAYVGIKAGMPECREAYQSVLSEEVWENPSSEQIDLVVQRVKKDRRPQSLPVEQNQSLAVVESEVSENLAEAIPQPEVFEITPQGNPDIWAMLQPPSEAEEVSIASAAALQITALDQTPEQAPLFKTEDGIVGPSTINQAEFTQAISTAIRQLGIDNSSEATQLLSAMAIELSSDITDTQQMVTALVTAYLNKRQSVLSSAIGALNTVRSAQTESFQSGLTDDFFDQKRKNKEAFLSEMRATFN